MFALIVRLEGEKQGRQFSHLARNKAGEVIGIHRYPKKTGRWVRSYYESRQEAREVMEAFARVFPYEEIILSVREVR